MINRIEQKAKHNTHKSKMNNIVLAGFCSFVCKSAEF